MNNSSSAAWVGRTCETEDFLGQRQVARIAHTLDEPPLAVGDALPPLWHWAFFDNPVAGAQLGADGHAARGTFLPPAEGRNRMWAGGRLDFSGELRVGESARCVSTLLRIEEKAGRSGSLLFVTVEHRYFQQGQLVLREEQDLVYREPGAPKAGSGESIAHGSWAEEVVPESTLLFRYSAVTFNGHRIHYDWPYATRQEGYAGLVVHGPLIATLLLRSFRRAHPAARLRTFSYRGLRPLIAPSPFTLTGQVVAPGQAELWAGNGDGVAQVGQVRFE
ncbi:FAS1-like dehydratase domain-containing protein [Pseudomonas oryzihabitans]|uniref:FAS1-like dehydratase domain-containing protein n=1 Tax=Pseudomonas oryzihabitans TaxID=47885 RepID=UPI00241DCEBF|nr:MaoC family dehydratase N-terminal domain-containing protein [Pseudomonas oryzihabitans]